MRLVACRFPQITRKFLSPVVQVAFIGVAPDAARILLHDCQFTWPKDKPVEPDNDIIGWPKRPHFWHPNFWHKEPAQPVLKKTVERKTWREIKRCNEQRSPETEVAVFLSD